ncbi:MAG: tyrosine/phenylalanine carboxypeptidase domain-containing protein, partial [Pirellulales bacterium]
MASETFPEIDAAYDSVAAVVRDRLSRNLRIRRNLPEGGRVRIDRQLPFLCVYRAPATGKDAGTCDLVTTEAAYLFAAGESAHEAGLDRLVSAIAETMREHFGAFLVVEIWAKDDRPVGTSPRDATRPGFRLVANQGAALARTLQALVAGLRDIRLQGWAAEVESVDDQTSSLSGRAPLAAALANEGVHAIGLAVRPVYRDLRTRGVYPAVLRSLRRQLAVALRKGVFAFTGKQKEEPLAHYEALGPSSMVKSARLVDQELSEVSQSFDFVLQTLPLNSAVAWEEFQAGGYTQDPVFYYRPLPYDPAQLKRRLFAIPIDRIEDSTLIHLFAEKQDHLDRQLTALKNIGAPPFYYDSIQLYGTPGAELVTLARAVLDRIESGDESRPNDVVVHAEELVAAAREEIDFYHQRLPGFVAKVEIRNDLAASMMV